MRILYFAPHRVWPLNTGSRLRDYHLARQLAKRAHVTFIEVSHPGDQIATLPTDPDLQDIFTVYKAPSYTPSKVIRGLIGPVPVTVLNFFSPRIVARLSELLRPGVFTSAQIASVQLSQYIPLIRRLCGPIRIVSDWHNIESELLYRYALNSHSRLHAFVARRTAKLLGKVELELLAECEAHTTTSERERRRLLEWNPQSCVTVIDNGVNAAEYAPERREQEVVPSLLFAGSMDYHANIDAVIWFACEIWPAIAAKHPSLKLIIAGRNPSPGVRALESDRIRVTGTVADIRPYYWNATALVVPLRVASGTRLKILEAMAAGLPVASTTLGAEGIEAVHGEHLLLADNAAELAAAVHRLIISKEVRTRIAAAASALIRRKYEWSIIGEKLFQVHQQIASTDVHS
jgi:polysaccharide biosynthesis protein PslH